MSAGRPRIFKTAKQLNAVIEEYFSSIKDEKGLYIEPPTITGLAYFLGFESRQSFYDYEKVSEFSYIVKRARLRVENFAEQQMYGKTPAGAIFVLKNMGWTDKQELEHSGGMSNTVTHDLSKLSLEELETLERLAKKSNGN